MKGSPKQEDITVRPRDLREAAKHTELLCEAAEGEKGPVAKNIVDA